jgi:hypothetical protein
MPMSSYNLFYFSIKYEYLFSLISNSSVCLVCVCVCVYIYIKIKNKGIKYLQISSKLIPIIILIKKNIITCNDCITTKMISHLPTN